MKIETTIRRTELTVEKTETFTISRKRRFVFEHGMGCEHRTADAAKHIIHRLVEIDSDAGGERPGQS